MYIIGFRTGYQLALACTNVFSKVKCIIYIIVYLHYILNYICRSVFTHKYAFSY